MTAESLALAAEALEGAPFRLHGRDPVTGLDCIGVLAQSLEAIGRPSDLPAAYSVRARTIPKLAEIVSQSGFILAKGLPVPGDVLLARIGPMQLHLLIAATDGRFVHAHAGLGKVVTGPLPEAWQVAGHWRLAEPSKGS